MTRSLLQIGMLATWLLWAPPYTQAQTYSEAPELRTLVEKGELPPVEERLPDEPLVVEPYEEIGQYGGSWLRMMKGTSDFHAYGRCVYCLLYTSPSPRDS